MEIQDHHEKLFLVLAVLVGVVTVTNVALTQRASNLERAVADLQSQIYPIPQDTPTVKQYNIQPTTTIVQIGALIPTSGSVGDRVQVSGMGFDLVGNKIHLGSAVILADSPDGATLFFDVPAFLSPTKRIQAKTYTVTVETSRGISNAVDFTVKP